MNTGFYKTLDEVSSNCDPKFYKPIEEEGRDPGFYKPIETKTMTQEEYNGKALLYVCNRSHENGYKEAVNKMIELLDKRLDNYNIHWVEDEYCWTKEMFLEQLRKTMMEGRGNETIRQREEDNA